MKPNPLLAPLSPLVGTWRTEGSHPYLAGTLHGRSSFEWLESGAFLVWRSEIDEPGVPTGIAIIGGDDSSGELFMLYFDERGVSRKYDVSMSGATMRWWRNAPDFAQRYTLEIASDGQTLVGRGELSKDGKTWERDLDLTYRR